MDMTLAEQLVWAAAYSQHWNAVRRMTMTPLDLQVTQCAEFATDVVLSMRDGIKRIVKENNRAQISPRAMEHLRQMTFKAED